MTKTQAAGGGPGGLDLTPGALSSDAAYDAWLERPGHLERRKCRRLMLS